MKIKIIILFFSFLISHFSFLNAVSPAHAAFSCQPIYGGGQTCVSTEAISVNKTIMHPVTNVMVDNLGINDPKFAADSALTFQIAVKNTSKSTINRIDVTDTFPQFTIFNTGPGTFNGNTNILSLGIDNLKPNETEVFTVVGKVSALDKLSFSGQVVCVVNQAIARTNTGETSQDNTQFCIDKKAAAITKGGFPVFPSVTTYATPSTGPESLALISLVPAGIAGWFLRKHSIKKEALN